MTPTKKQRRDRLDTIERTMAEIGWNGRIVRELAARFSVTERTIYNYRAEVLEDLASCYRGKDRDQDRAEFICRLRERQAAALATGQWGSVSSMMGIEAKVLGIEDLGAGSATETLVIVKPKITT